MRRYNCTFILSLVCFIQGSLYAQDFRVSEPQKDSVVIRHENGEEEVRYIFHAIEPKRISDTTQVGVHSSEAKTVELQSITPEIKLQSISSLSNYAVGAIPIQSGVTPTGGKTYSIPIMTAPGYHLVPNISLYYNSQSGNGVAGYGWSIVGLSSIEIRDKNLFYDGAQEGAMYSDPTACYSLDGVPIVKSENLMKGYELATAKGNIQIHKHQNSYATPSYFEVLYPNGSKAVFGFKDNYESQISYPITEYEDIDGNKMTFEYMIEGNVYYITSIRYGRDADIQFLYSRRSELPIKDYYVSGKRTDRLFYLLDEVVVTEGSKALCDYQLETVFKDNVSLLKKIRVRTNGQELPPLEFTYRIDNKDALSDYPVFDLEQTSIYKEFFKESTDPTILYKRGKVSPWSKNDVIVSLPSYPNYANIGNLKRGLKTYNKYGSKYDPKQRILINMDNRYEVEQERVYAGDGFQTIDIVDIDGDGLDEIVKINNSSTKRSVTDYKITIYKIDDRARKDSSTFTITVNDGTYNDVFTNPVKSLYYYGNFKGDGKTQLVIATRYRSKLVLVDLEKKEKLCEIKQFTINEVDETRIFAADFENKGKTDLVHITEDGADIYSFRNNTFHYDRTYKGAGLNDICLSNNYIVNGKYQVVPCSIFSMDINGDGYNDIVSMPSILKINGSEQYSNLVYTALFNGKSFESYAYNLFTRWKHSQPTFVDVDKDGLPDILYSDDESLYCIFNFYGEYKNTSVNVGVAMSPSKVIAPTDATIWGKYADILLVEGADIEQYTFRRNRAENRQIVWMSDSFGNTDYNAYTNLFAANDYYEEDYQRQYSSGYRRRALPIYVLTNNIEYEGNSSIKSNSVFYYTDAVYNTQGLGFCGFGKMETSEAVSRTVTTQTFDPEKFGAITQTTIRKSNAQSPYSITTNTYDSHSTTYGKLDPRLISSRTQDNLSGITTTISYTYDKYGYPLTIETKKDLSGFPTQSTIVRNRYAYVTMEGEYVLGVLLNDAIDTNLDSKADTVWREANAYQRDKWCHLLSKTTNRGLVKSGQSAEGTIGTRQVSCTKWTYDSTWNVTSEKMAMYNSSEYVGKTYKYDSSGRFLETSTDALGRTTTYSDYTKLGKPTKEIDYNGNETSYEYDALGNLLKTTKPDGAQYVTSYEWGGKGLYKVTTTGTDTPRTISHYDSRGREISTQIQRFDGTYQNREKCYDDRGRLIKESLPYKGDTSRYWITYKYDGYDRIISKNEPSGKVSTWKYAGTATTSTIEGITSTKKTDAAGNVVNIVDGGGIITYDYRDDGQPKRIIAPGNVQTTFEYDIYGRRIKIDDPSAGERTESYVWNTDGTSNSTHTNPNGWIKEYKDKYGRAILVERSDGYSTTYTYDVKGRLTTEISTNGCAKEYVYDNHDRVTQIKESVPDGKFLETQYGYRKGGQIDSIRYSSQHKYMVTECYQYANGHNTGIRLTDGTQVWSLIRENDFGQPIEINTDGIKREYGYTEYGLPTYRRIDGGEIQEERYEFDPKTGNLLARTEYSGGPRETFTYDKMNRLTGINGRSIRYQNNGNITEIEGVGQMRYANASKPYQLTALYPEDSVNVGGVQRVTYSCENRPLTIIEGGKSVEFTYGADGKRVKMVEKDNGLIKKIHWYVGDKYEYVANGSGGEESETLYLGGDAYNAPMMWRSGNDDWQIGRDYLGSIKQVVAPDGALSGDYSYDPWGRMRNKHTLEVYEMGKEPDLFIGRGYTGHEHLPQFGLINMNARLYDPLLGRFLSPDPYVQAPDFTQNFNRYSYALNNPLKYTDEDGEWIHIAIGALIGGVSNLISQWDNCTGLWQYVAAFGVGAGAGAITAATGGASIIATSFVGALSSSMISATNSIISQTGNNFSGIENVNWKSVGVSASTGALSGAVSSFVGKIIPNFSEKVSSIVNGYNCPILFSFTSSAIVGGVTQSSANFITGLAMGLDAKTSLDYAIASLPKSMLISGVIGSITTGVSMSFDGINPFTGDPYNMVTSNELGLNGEVNRIRNNIKYDYRHDGTIYENRESILPSNTTYHEYVVPSENISGPGHLRIVVGKNGSWYYTPDHFKTFIKFRP